MNTRRLRASALAILGTIGVYSLARGAAPSQEMGVSITFLANEGVLLADGERQVLIDALFQPYGRGYAVPHDSTQGQLARARRPFHGVDAILVTHRHGDHFHPAPVVSHLQANPGATLVTSAQVIDSLRGHLPAGHALASRLRARTTPPGERRRETVAGIRIELLGLPHGGERHAHVEHLGYIVELGGRRVLHVGDADISAAAFAPLRLDTARIDVALLPAWMLTSAEGRRTIAQWIRPRQVVGIHLDANATPSEVARVTHNMPGALAFTRSLAVRRW